MQLVLEKFIGGVFMGFVLLGKCFLRITFCRKPEVVIVKLPERPNEVTCTGPCAIVEGVKLLVPWYLTCMTRRRRDRLRRKDHALTTVQIHADRRLA